MGALSRHACDIDWQAETELSSATALLLGRISALATIKLSLELLGNPNLNVALI